MSVGYTRTGATVFDGYGEDVKVGDKITVLAVRLNADGNPVDFGTERGDAHCAIVTSLNVTNGFNQRGFEWHAANTNGGLGWLANEGVHWIRDWHKTTSATIDALLATAHLVRSTA